jgi:ribosome biogenesis GTPase
LIDPRLTRLGISEDRLAGLSAAEVSRLSRIVSMQRTGLTLNDGEREISVPMAGRWFKPGSPQKPVVGDWVVVNEAGNAVAMLVERRNLLRRREVDGHGAQAIAANIDTLFIVTACNTEFSASRLERYLLVAEDAGVTPVIVLTKVDCLLVDRLDVGGVGTNTATTPDAYIDAVKAVAPSAPVHALDARDPDAVASLKTWCGPGRTLVLLGSSGVGKSTLLNSLAGSDRQKTGAVRSADDKGRHTTSHRSLHTLPDGTLVIDSPGIRELGLPDAHIDPSTAFDDILELSLACRFRDCGHGTEPGCAVQAAVQTGSIEQRRLDNWRRMHAEQVERREIVRARSDRSREWTKGKGKIARRLDED